MRLLAKRLARNVSAVFIWIEKLNDYGARQMAWVEASQNSVSQGSWCRKCAGYGKTIFDSIRAACLRERKCPTENYKKMFAKYQWGCAKGHIFKATATSMLNNESWCPIFNLASKNYIQTNDTKDFLKWNGLLVLKAGQCFSTGCRRANSSTVVPAKWAWEAGSANGC